MLESDTDSMLSPLSRIVRRPPIACSPDTMTANALATMRELAIGSMIVVDEGGVPLGILTLRDVVDRVALDPRAFEAPIAQVMTRDPVSLPLHESAYSAALAMIRHGVRHIVLVDSGKLAGIVSERDLFGLQSGGVRHLSTAIKSANDLPAVAQFGRDIGILAAEMAAQGVAAGALTAFIASLNDLLTERIVELEFREATLCGARYCWILMGSEGRTEQTLLTDQDNGIILSPAPNESVGQARARLLPIARRVNLALDRAGYRLCPGDIMAGNSAWCLSLEEWRDRFARWIDGGSPNALLHGAIFFDLRPLSGATELAHELRSWLLARTAANPRFLHQMAENALQHRPPIGRLRDFAVGKDGMIDLKVNGTMQFVDAARIYTLAHAVDLTNTEQRLRAVAPALNLAERESEAWIAGFHHIQGQRIRRQAERLAASLPLDNRVDPYALHDFDRPVLRLAFEQARAIQRRLALDFRV
jgi:CBS domain-containing protein